MFNFRDQIKDDSSLVQEAYASIIGKLACCLSGNFNLRPAITEPEILQRDYTILCNSFNVTSAEEIGSVKAAVFKPFLNLLESNIPSSVKLGKLSFACFFLLFAYYFLAIA